MAPCRVLIVGSTGYIGRHLAQAAIGAGHELFLLVRSPAGHHPDPDKAKFLQSMEASGAKLLEGSLENYPSLAEAVKRVDVVISAVSWAQVMDQTQLVKAILEAGTVKRFLPSEFGGDPDKIQGIRILDEQRHGKKAQVRRIMEAAGIPYTYVSSNSFAGHFIPNLCQLGKAGSIEEKVFVYGDGNTKAIFVDETDVATYTMRCIDDPRTLNKTLYIRPAKNIMSQNEIIEMWESRTGKKLQRLHLSSDELLKELEDNISTAFVYSIFIRGDQVNFEVGPPNGVEATELYPDHDYTTVRSYLERHLRYS